MAVNRIASILLLFPLAAPVAGQSIPSQWTWDISSDYGPRNEAGSFFHKGIDFNVFAGDVDRGIPIPAVEAGPILSIARNATFLEARVYGRDTVDVWFYGHIFQSPGPLTTQEWNSTAEWELRLNAGLVNPTNQADRVERNVIIRWQGGTATEVWTEIGGDGRWVEEPGVGFVPTAGGNAVARAIIERGEHIAPMGDAAAYNVHLHLGLNLDLGVSPPKDNPFLQLQHPDDIFSVSILNPPNGKIYGPTDLTDPIRFDAEIESQTGLDLDQVSFWIYQGETPIVHMGDPGQPTFSFGGRDGDDPTSIVLAMPAANQTGVTPQGNDPGLDRFAFYEDISSLPEGEYSFVVKCKDVNNFPCIDTSVTFSIDATPPTASGIAVTPDPIVYDAVVTAVATDGQSKVKGAEYKIGSKPWKPMWPSDGSFNSGNEPVYAPVDISDLDPDTYTIYVRAMDEAGQWSIPSDPSVGDGSSAVVQIAEAFSTVVVGCEAHVSHTDVGGGVIEGAQFDCSEDDVAIDGSNNGITQGPFSGAALAEISYSGPAGEISYGGYAKRHTEGNSITDDAGAGASMEIRIYTALPGEFVMTFSADFASEWVRSGAPFDFSAAYAVGTVRGDDGFGTQVICGSKDLSSGQTAEGNKNSNPVDNVIFCAAHRNPTTGRLFQINARGNAGVDGAAGYVQGIGIAGSIGYTISPEGNVLIPGPRVGSDKKGAVAGEPLPNPISTKIINNKSLAPQGGEIVYFLITDSGDNPAGFVETNTAADGTAFANFTPAQAGKYTIEAVCPGCAEGGRHLKFTVDVVSPKTKEDFPKAAPSES